MQKRHGDDANRDEHGCGTDDGAAAVAGFEPFAFELTYFREDGEILRTVVLRRHARDAFAVRTTLQPRLQLCALVGSETPLQTRQPCGSLLVSAIAPRE